MGQLKLNDKLTRALVAYTEGLLEAMEGARVPEDEYLDALTETDGYPRLQKVPVAEWMIGWIAGVAEANGVSIGAIWRHGLNLVNAKAAARAGRRKAA